MKSIVESVKRVDDQQKPCPMELGSFSEAHDHAEYVQWNDRGIPEWQETYDDWSPECAQGQEAQWNEDTQRLAAIAEADTSHRDALDAITAREAKAAKERKAKARAKVSSAKEKEKTYPRKPPGRRHRLSLRLESKRDSATTAASTDI